MYDPEATIQEADLEMAAYAREARELDRLRRQGLCVHSSAVGLPADGTIYYPEQEGLSGDQQRCTDGCGRVFETFEDLQHAEPSPLPLCVSCDQPRGFRHPCDVG